MVPPTDMKKTDSQNSRDSVPTVSDVSATQSYEIDLTMSDGLNGTQGDPSAFTISGAATNPKVTKVKVNDVFITLTLNKPISDSDNITIAYNHTGKDDLTNGTPVADFTGCEVTNVVPPQEKVNSAETLNEKHIVLTMSGELSDLEGDPSAFTISGAAAKPIVTHVIISGASATLILNREIVYGETIKVNYKHTGKNDLTNGTLVADFKNYPVTNELSKPKNVTTKLHNADVWSEMNNRPVGNEQVNISFHGTSGGYTVIKNLSSDDINKAVTINDMIYMINNDGTVLEYDTKADTWIKIDKIAELSDSNGLFKLTATKDKIYIVGVNLNSIYEYDPILKKCSLKTKLPAQAIVGGAIAIDNDIYVLSGSNIANRNVIENLDMYDLSQNIWTKKESILKNAENIKIAYSNGKIYILCEAQMYAASAPGEQNFEEYDIQKEKWTMISPSTTEWFGTGIGAVNGKLYIFPDYYNREGKSDNVKEYDPVSGKWTNRAETYGLFDGYATAVCNNEIYVIDGTNIEKYTPPNK